MACIINIVCHTCGKSSQECVGSMISPPTLCGSCRAKKIDRDRREHFGALDALTIEERIRNIEKYIYNYRAPTSLNEMKF